MRLRMLKEQDAVYMLEWMHDESVVRHLGTDFTSKTIEDCHQFIKNSQDCQNDLNMAIVDERDNYMGTASLKHIDRKLGMAEFAITIRKSAMGKGYSAYGMKEIIRIGFKELGLEKIIWCVSVENERAIKFYDKNGYQRMKTVPIMYKEYYSEEQLSKMVWYAVQR